MHSPYTPPPLRLGQLRELKYRRWYPNADKSVQDARTDFATRAKRAGLDPDVLDNAVVCLSELVTNAIVHAMPNYPDRTVGVAAEIRGIHRHFLHLEVHDPDDGHVPHFPSPFTPTADFEATSGRGLFLIANLADKTGVEAGERTYGKSVWCTLYLPADSAPASVVRSRATVDVPLVGACANPPIV